MNPIKKELDSIAIPEDVMERMYKGMQQAKQEEQAPVPIKRTISKRKKIIAAIASLAAVGGLFIGSAFVSPAMAQMAAKIPYLKDIFINDVQLTGSNSKPVFDTLREEALELGITVQGMGMGFEQAGDDPDALVIVLQDKDYNKATKMKVEEMVKEILDQKGYYAKDIQVIPQNEDFYKTMMRINVLMNQQAKEIQQILKNKGFGVQFVGMNRDPDEIFVILPDTEMRVEEIRSLIQDYQKNIYNEFSLDIRMVDPSGMDPETKLKRDLYTIFERLVAKKEFKVEYFKYETQGQLTLTIKASIDSYNTEEAKMADRIRSDVRAILDKEYQLPYKIEILGINDEKID
jgi:hypothetical protein